MTISANSDINIVIPQTPTPRESFAAEELCTFLGKIFSATPVVSSEPSDGVNFIIGAPCRNVHAASLISDKEFESLVPGPEGMMIKNFGNNILIAGSNGDDTENERGTIYAVYEFLERYLGVSFAAYVNPDISGGDYIPEYEAIELENIEYIKPFSDLKYRTAIVQYADAQGDPIHGFNVPFFNWLIRNRYNRILTWCGIYDGYKKNGMLQEAEKRGIRFTVGHHASSQMFLPPFGNECFPEHYYETHPEYYKLKSDGTRYKPDGFFGQWIFCSRNEDLINTISDNIINWIAQNPMVDIIAFWPNDGMDEQCGCDDCKKHTKVANYTYFQNSVAKRVAKVYPYVKIDMLVYVDLWECPDGQKLEPSLIVDEATWHDTGLRKPGKPNGGGIIGTLFEDNLLKWHNVGAEVVYYDYYMGVYPARQRLIPMADEIQALSKRYLEKGIMGTGTQIECFNMWNHIFNYYCFARTAYDTSLSMEDNLDRFTRIFGNGAEYVKEIIRTCEECLDGQESIMTAGKYLMLNIDKEKVYALYEKAFEAAITPAQRNNVRMMRMAFRYSDVECAESTVKPAPPYSSLRKYEDPTGELYFMSRFDSFKHNNPGYGITIPVDCAPTDKFTPDKWYEFEK